MEIDAKLIITVGGMLVSIVSAAAIVKQKLSAVIQQLEKITRDYEDRLRDLDKRTDRQENLIDLNAQKTPMFCRGLCHQRLERNNRELERILVMVTNNDDRLSKIEKMHNGRHPTVE